MIRLESEMKDRMEAHLAETLSSVKVQESSLLQNMESLQEKLHRSESKAIETDMELEKLRFQAETERRKLQDERDAILGKYTNDITSSNREIEQLTKGRDKEVAELQSAIDRLKENQSNLQKKIEGL